MLGACGMPQASDPAPAPQALETPPVLLGGLDAEVKAASAMPATARRPGWGTMDPIPNPTPTREFASATPPYRLIGPTSPEANTTLALAPQAREPGAEAPRGTRGKPRVRHLIVPVRNPG
jgi:hypothetical protein